MKKILYFFVIFLFLVSCNSAPKIKKVNIDDLFAFENENNEFQTDIIFPRPKNDYDDSVVTNNFVSFKSYRGQGVIYFKAKNIKSISIFLNGIKINSKNICKNEYSKIFVGNIVKDGQNLLLVSGIEPETDINGQKETPFLNIKIPYPTILRPSLRKIKKTQINYRGFEIVDDLVEAQIENGFPSAQIAILKNGNMIKNSAYGFISTVDEFGNPLKKSKRQKITKQTIFDLASNTKMYSVNFALQKLVSDGKISLDDKVRKFFPNSKDDKRAKHKGKDKIAVGDLLKQQAGFPAGGQYCNRKEIKKKKKGDARTNKEITLELICKTPLRYKPGTEVLYSDIDYMLLGLIIEKITEVDLDEFVEKNIYKILSLDYICYTPLKKGFSKDQIAATEINGIKRTKDLKYKDEKYLPIHGEVHDPEAYWAMDQVSGHAGLFANAESVANLAQTMLNGGGYGCVKLFDSQVLNLFASPTDDLSPSGLGWRRQGAHKTYSWAFSQMASTNTIGHTGWTGSFASIDFKENLVIIILTSAKNTPALKGFKLRGKYEGDFYLLKNYGAITSFIYAAVNNYSDEILDNMLIELAIKRYELLNSGNAIYNNVGFKKDLHSIIDTLKKQARYSISIRKFLRSETAKKINNSIKKI